MSIPEFSCWTIESVKRELPQIDINWGGFFYLADVTRINEDSAGVTFYPGVSSKVMRIVPWYRIVSALNNNEKVNIHE